jgi:glycosyltransferase involved in cell wall biosynthesis
MSCAAEVASRLKKTDADVVFSPSTIPICYLNTKTPIAFWTDATVAGVVGFYPHYSNLCKESLDDFHKMEQAALSNCRLAIYSSDWAAATAINKYQVDSSKVKVVPFGANVDCSRALENIREIVSRKRADVCKLLFLGTEWYRKGGDIAVAVLRSLNEKGLRAELTIVGCDVEGTAPDSVSAKGFVSKRTREGQATIDRLFAESHFLVLPSRADCVPVAIAEANSYGVPVISSNVGGITTAVRDGVNGFALPHSDRFVEDASSIIRKYMGSPADYQCLAEQSFGEYTQRLNWKTSARRVHELLQGVLNEAGEFRGR